MICIDALNECENNKFIVLITRLNFFSFLPESRLSTARLANEHLGALPWEAMEPKVRGLQLGEAAFFSKCKFARKYSSMMNATTCYIRKK